MTLRPFERETQRSICADGLAAVKVSRGDLLVAGPDVIRIRVWAADQLHYVGIHLRSGAYKEVTFRPDGHLDEVNLIRSFPLRHLNDLFGRSPVAQG